MTDTWFSAQQLSGIPGMPGTDRRVISRAEKNLWVIRNKLRGKGREYALSSLPAETQAYLLAQTPTALPVNKPAPLALAVSGDPIRSVTPSTVMAVTPAAPDSAVSGVARDGALVVHVPSPHLENLVGMTLVQAAAPAKKRAVEAVRRYQVIAPILEKRITGRVAIEAHAAAHGASVATVYRWITDFKAGGAAALAPKSRADAGSARVLISGEWEIAARGAGILSPQRVAIAEEVVKGIRGLWAQQGVASCKQIQMLMKPEIHRLSVAAGMPAEVALKVSIAPRKFVEAEKRFSVIALLNRDAKGFYDQVSTSIRRSRNQLQPGDVVFGDVSPSDIPVLQPDGRIGWARFIAWRDAATNMFHITGYLAAKGSGVRREHVALSFAQMCQDSPWGLPKRLYLDNGSEYNWAEMLNSWSELAKFTGGVFGGTWGAEGLDEVGKIWRTEPYKPRAKLIEGGFSNLMAFMGWHPCFAGSDRLTKKTQSLGQALEPTTLDNLRVYTGEAIQFYHGVPQGGDHMNGLSPAEKMAEFQNAGFKRVTVDAETLALAFASSEERRVSAGTVTTGSWEYHHPTLYQWQGEKVIVRWARHAPDAAYIFHPKTRQFLCVALPMPIFQFMDKKGAEYAGRLAAEARKAVTVMKGQVAWLDPRDLMGEFAALSGVQNVITAAEVGSRKIELSEEARGMIEARNATALAAVVRSDAGQGLGKVPLIRLAGQSAEEAAEAEAARLFG